MESRKQFSQRAPALYLLPGLISGLLLSRLVPSGSLALFVALLFASFAWLLARRGYQLLWLLAFASSSILGFWAYGTLRLPLPPTDAVLNTPPREAIVTFEVQRIMQLENKFGSSTGIGRVINASATSQLEPGRLLYFRLSRTDSAQVEMMRGLTVEVTGVLHPIPNDTPSDSFDGYLHETGVHYRLQRTRSVRIVEDASAFKRLCHFTNLRFQEHLRLGEPPGWGLSQIYIAMLLGQKTELSDEQKGRFRATGTMHLFAISGLHIGVIATVIWQLLLLCRVPRRWSPLLGLPLLYFYVEVTGAAPSAVRAFLMVAFFWASAGLQRQRSPLAALAASAVFVLILQPSQLWQMGFQLSYLVVISLLIYGLPLQQKLWDWIEPYKYLPRPNWSSLQTLIHWSIQALLVLFVISLAAWLASAPLGAGFFGYIATYAIFVNILLVNLAALVISCGVISLTIASIGLEGVSAFLNHAAWSGLALMDGLVKLNLELPAATIDCPDFPRMAGYLIVLAYLISIFSLSHSRHARLRFSLPPVIVLTGLLIGVVLNG